VFLFYFLSLFRPYCFCVAQSQRGISSSSSRSAPWTGWNLRYIDQTDGHSFIAPSKFQSITACVSFAFTPTPLTLLGLDGTIIGNCESQCPSVDLVRHGSNLTTVEKQGSVVSRYPGLQFIHPSDLLQITVRFFYSGLSVYLIDIHFAGSIWKNRK